MVLSNIGNEIRNQRIKQGISQEQLANKAQLDRTYIAGVENGKRNLTIMSLAKILNALDVSFSDFFQEISI